MQLSVVGPDTSPQVRDITPEVERTGNHAYAFGGFGDLWKGTWRGPQGEKAVAIKVLRISNDPKIQEKIGKRVRKELRIWQCLNHPNIIPLCGVSSAFGFYDSFVCPWMELGSLSTFLKNAEATLNLSRRLEILRDAADGLNYLHQENIVHGDLTSPNVLLDSNGLAVLCDFGLSGVVAEVMSATFITSTISGNARWMAPELMALSLEDTDVPVIKTTHQTDMYSFGCLTLETLSGKRPYYYYTTEQQVLLSVSQGIKPRRPARDVVSDKLWKFIQQCWAPAGQRISAQLALEYIRGFLADEGVKANMDES